MDPKHYAELPPTVRAFLETLSEEKVVTLVNSLEFYGKLTPESKRFLLHSKKETLEWLQGAREDEIKKLDEGIRLVTSANTVGKFVKWIVITIIASFVLVTQMADAINNFLNFIRGRAG